MKPSMIIAVVFLFIVSLSHLLRAIYQVQLIVGSTEIPMWSSVAACIFAAALAIWLLAENRKRTPCRTETSPTKRHAQHS